MKHTLLFPYKRKMKWKAFLVYKKTHLQQGFDIKAFTDIIHSDSQQIKVGFAFRSFFPIVTSVTCPKTITSKQGFFWQSKRNQKSALGSMVHYPARCQVETYS